MRSFSHSLLVLLFTCSMVLILVIFSRPRTSPTIVFICTQIRSGSRITGELLSLARNVFYTEEPLSIAISCNEKISNVTKFLHDIMQCDFGNYQKYFACRYIHHQTNDFYNIGIEFPRAVFDPKRVRELCMASRIRVIRLTSARLEDVIPLLNDEKHSVKVISLVRDPRAAFASRRNLSPDKQNSSDSLIREICERMITNLNAEKLIGYHAMQKYRRIRYEDVMLQPEKTIKDLDNWIGISYTKVVESFINQYTQIDVDEKNPFSLMKKSSTRPVVWASYLTYNEAHRIQTLCETVFHKFKYPLVHSQDQMEAINSSMYSLP